MTPFSAVNVCCFLLLSRVCLYPLYYLTNFSISRVRKLHFSYSYSAGKWEQTFPRQASAEVAEDSVSQSVNTHCDSERTLKTRLHVLFSRFLLHHLIQAAWLSIFVFPENPISFAVVSMFINICARVENTVITFSYFPSKLLHSYLVTFL